jgi:hypothetical protein
VEAYNESMKGEIAVTRRAAYAAEGAVQKLEKEKMSQDYLIADMQVGWGGYRCGTADADAGASM